MKIKVTFFIFLIFVNVFLNGIIAAEERTIHFKRITIDDGLSQSAIFCFMQDSRGFLWIGTQDGLNKYDGYTFQVFKPDRDDPNSLSNNWITALCEDNSGKIWIGTRGGGLNKLDPEQEKFTRYPFSKDNPGCIDSGYIETVYQGSSGAIWVGTRGGGLSKITMEIDGENPERVKEKIHNYRHIPSNPNSLADDTVNSILQDRAGSFWIGTNNGLDKLDEKNGVFNHYVHNPHDPNSLSDNYIHAIYEDSEGLIWIGAHRGLNSFDKKTGKFTNYRNRPEDPNSLSYDNISAIIEDYSGVLWISTMGGGLNKFNKKTGTFTHYRYTPDDPNSISYDIIQCIYEDRSHTIWIGTSGKGLNLFDRLHNFQLYRSILNNPNSLGNNYIYSVYQDHLGLIWIGTSGGGLDRFNRETGTFTHFRSSPDNPRSPSNNVIRSIFEDRSGVLWVGTGGSGLNRFDREKGDFSHFRCRPQTHSAVNSVYCIFEDLSGTLWLGTGGGLSKFDGKTGTFKLYRNIVNNPGNPGDNDLNVVYETSTEPGVLWLGTRNRGIDRFDTLTETFSNCKADPDEPDSLSANFVLTFCEDRSGTLWVGTHGGGLNKLIGRSADGKLRFDHYSERDGLANNTIYGILEDSHGCLWLSTNKGISKFDPQAGTFKNYYVKDGIQGNEFNSGAYHKNKKGEMFFGGVNGLTCFYADDIKVNRNIPPIVITDFRVFNKPVAIGGDSPLKKSIAWTKEIKLPYKKKTISFEFIALDFIAPEKNKYAYKMEGFDKDWNYPDPGKRVAFYTNLNAGEYVFRVKGSNNDGIWNEAGTAIKITIIPPFWQTPFFRIISLIVLISLVFLLYRARVKSIKNRQKELEQKVQQRTHELREANEYKSQFLARMSHEIRTPMNSIIGFTDMLLDTGLNEEQENYTRTIHHSGETLLVLLNDILDISRIEAGQLSFDPIDFDPEVTVFDVCESMVPRVENKPVEILCRIGDFVPAYVRTDPVRFRQVLLNLMGNAVKFTEEGEIEISLDVEETYKNQLKLHVRVKDTGIGIQVDKLETIFGVFQQADGTVTRKYGGTGLGLAICKEIAKMMQGDVWAENRPGKGSIFHFIGWVEKSGKAAPAVSAPVHLSGKKVLVVDDNVNNLDILTHILEKADLRVFSLTAGEQVTAELQRAFSAGEPFDLCILDIHLPGISGYDILKEIRSSGPAVANLPVLAFSSSTLGQSKKMKAAGFDGFLPKPISRRRLIDMTSRLLGGIAAEGDWRERDMLVTQHTLVEEAKHSLRILLAEDNPINRKLAGFMLTKAGYKLDVVTNGQEAVDVFTASPQNYDIILMDVHMPGMDGIEATKIIRAKGFKAIPIIAVTADVMKGDREKLLEAGMDDYISKPIKREVVFDKVKKWAIDRNAITG